MAPSQNSFSKALEKKDGNLGSNKTYQGQDRDELTKSSLNSCQQNNQGENIGLFGPYVSLMTPKLRN